MGERPARRKPRMGFVQARVATIAKARGPSPTAFGRHRWQGHGPATREG
jgi:hypothetical protein